MNVLYVTLYPFIIVKFCVATIGVCVFGVRTSVLHTFLVLNAEIYFRRNKMEEPIMYSPGSCDIIYSANDFPVFPRLLPEGAKFADSLSEIDLPYIERVVDKYIEEKLAVAQKECSDYGSFDFLGYSTLIAKATMISVEKDGTPPRLEFIKQETPAGIKYCNKLSLGYIIKHNSSEVSGEYDLEICIHDIVILGDKSTVWCGFSVT